MSGSAWAPLRNPSFRGLWIGGVLVNFAVSMQNLTMSNPRYEGFNKDGSHFVVTAK